MPSYSTPLTSVVIPTYGRPQFLATAIDSALQSSPEEGTEVIVVPNGPDTSWMQSANEYKKDHRVHWHPIEKAHANAARNHGLRLSRGKYIRFLDDDDHLISEAAIKQIHIAETLNLDAISGGIESIHTFKRKSFYLNQPNTTDIVTAMLSPERVTNPHAHLFLRSSLEGTHWNENLNVRQDTDYLIRYAIKENLKWQRIDDIVGTWVHHNSPRIFPGNDPGPEALQHTAQLILDAANILRERNQLDDERRYAAANGIWSTAQKGLVYEWNFWIDAIATARELCPTSRPPSKIYTLAGKAGIPALWVAIALLPPRHILKTYRQFMAQRTRPESLS